MAITWNDLFLSGSIVDLATSKWRGRVRLTPKDLGIADSDEVDKALTLGTNRLAPREAFEVIDTIHARARRAIDHASLSFGFVRGARYVPDKNMKELAEKLDACARDFADAVASFIANYDQIKAEMLPVITKALQDAARTPEAAAEAVARIIEEYPSAEDVRRKFNLSWNVYAIQGPRKAGASAAMDDEKANVRGVVRAMVQELREEVIGKLGDVLRLIQTGGKLQPKSVESALAVLDHVDAVNVLGDAQLASYVAKLRAVLTQIDTSARVSDATITGLQDIKVQLEGSIEEAVAAAEKQLTAVGRRKLEVA